MYRDIPTLVLSSTRFLGLLLDSELNFSDHTLALTRKLNSVVYTLRCLRSSVKRDVLRVVYYSNFQSLLSYGIIFWGSSSTAYNVFIVQKLALRTLLGLGYRASCRGVFRENNVLTLQGLYIYRLLTFLFKNKHYFEEFKNVNNTRRTVSYFCPIHSLAVTERGVVCMAIKVFNSLPMQIRSLSSYEIFEKEVHSLVMRIEPYTVSEFLLFFKA